MSYTDTQWEVAEAPVKNTKLSIPFTELTSQEDLVAFLMSDPPTEVLDDTETDATAPNEGGDPSMQRNKSIAALKQQLSDLSITTDDELFKSSCLNVAKYVVYPMPDTSVSTEEDDSSMMACHANGTSDEQSIAAVEGIDTGSKSDEDLSKNSDGDVNEHVDQHVDEKVDLKTNEGAKERETGNVAEDGNPPRIPPNTPDVEERIWWGNEFFVVKKSALGGLGAFAAKDLEYGEKILEEMPLLRANNWGICNEYDCLSDEDRELFHTLHKFSSNPAAHDIEKIRRANSFQLPKGVAIYSVTSRFNHACLPVRNVNYVIDGNGDAKIKLTVLKAIPKGTELTICYGGKPEQLLRGFGFRCQCGGCNPLTDNEADAIMKTWRGDQNWSNQWQGDRNWSKSNQWRSENWTTQW